MEARRIHQLVETDGEITVRGLPCKRGQQVEMILLLDEEAKAAGELPTAQDLLGSGLVGMWADRTDIGDSSGFARTLRARALRGSPSP
jgi:hypothetical protein